MKRNYEFKISTSHPPPLKSTFAIRTKGGKHRLREGYDEHGNAKQEGGENGGTGVLQIARRLCLQDAFPLQLFYPSVSLHPSLLPKIEHIGPMNARLIVLDWVSLVIAPSFLPLLARACLLVSPC